MSEPAKHLNPSDLSDESLDRLAFALVGRLTKYAIVTRPMKSKEAIEFSGVGKNTFYRMRNAGRIKEHRPFQDCDPVYFADEIIEALKKK